MVSTQLTANGNPRVGHRQGETAISTLGDAISVPLTPLTGKLCEGS
jgi:hypothetical protein